MQITARRLTFLFVPLALFAGACGRLSDDGPADDGTTGPPPPVVGIQHPTGADELVLRLFTGGGFTPPEYQLANFPQFSLMGDGRVVVAGAQIEIYPPPALPAMVEFQLTEEGVQALLEAARDAGLFELDGQFGNNCVADAATTVFTVVAEGETHTVSAYALGLEDSGNCASADVKAVRAKLSELSQKVSDLRSWLPEGSVGEEQQYDFDALRIYATPARMGDADPGLEPSSATWPLDVPLSKFGEPIEYPEQTRCGVVTGADLDTLMESLRTSNTVTFWESGGETYHLILRPLLPDETGCTLAEFTQSY